MASFKKDGVFESNFGQGLSQLGQEDVDLEMTYFINSEDSDDNLTFVPLRDQKMPKPW